jgi:hypothetical protein
MNRKAMIIAVLIGLVLSSVFLFSGANAVSGDGENKSPINIEFSTLFGGSGEDGTGRVAIDSQGNIVLASKSPSTDFPILNAYQPVNNGSDDGVIIKFSPDGQELLFSTFFGGSGIECIYTVAVDSNDDISNFERQVGIRACCGFNNTYLLSGDITTGVRNQRTDERMRIKLFVEPSGKAREEVLLESCVPMEMQQIRQWIESWIPQKEFKRWEKETISNRMLGDIRQGKIVEATLINPDGDTSFKGEMLACRSYVTEKTGAKKKLPMVLFAKLKNIIDFEFFNKRMTLNSEEQEELKEALKRDVWAPVSVWNPQLVDRKHIVNTAEVLPFAIQYTRALFSLDPESAGLSKFIETEILKS